MGLIPGFDPLEKEMATHSSILAWEIPWTESSRLQSMRLKKVGHDWAYTHTHHASFLGHFLLWCVPSFLVNKYLYFSYDSKVLSSGLRIESFSAWKLEDSTIPSCALALRWHCSSVDRAPGKYPRPKWAFPSGSYWPFPHSSSFTLL